MNKDSSQNASKHCELVKMGLVQKNFFIDQKVIRCRFVMEFDQDDGKRRQPTSSKTFLQSRRFSSHIPKTILGIIRVFLVYSDEDNSENYQGLVRTLRLSRFLELRVVIMNSESGLSERPGFSSPIPAKLILVITKCSHCEFRKNRFAELLVPSSYIPKKTILRRIFLRQFSPGSFSFIPKETIFKVPSLHTTH